jgi:hypothetical protein
MNRLTKNALAAGIALASAATVTGITTPAFADSTWTVSPGGSVTATSQGVVPHVTAYEIEQGTAAVCDYVDGSATLPSGSGLSGNGIVSLSSFAFHNCVGPNNLTITINPTGLPWSLNATSYDATGGVTTGTLTGITGNITVSDGCVAGFSAGLDGSSNQIPAHVTGTYTNSTGVLKITEDSPAPPTTTPTSSNIVVDSVNSSCNPTLIGLGDHIALYGSVAVSPGQTVTSP